MDSEAAKRLKRVKLRTGQSESDQIRAAVNAWLDRADAAKRHRKETRKLGKG